MTPEDFFLFLSLFCLSHSCFLTKEGFEIIYIKKCAFIAESKMIKRIISSKETQQ